MRRIGSQKAQNILQRVTLSSFPSGDHEALKSENELLKSELGLEKKLNQIAWNALVEWGMRLAVCYPSYKIFPLWVGIGVAPGHDRIRPLREAFLELHRGVGNIVWDHREKIDVLNGQDKKIRREIGVLRTVAQTEEALLEVVGRF
ncbi:hypothetical protein MKZ38_001545 [Zalerion maritima]|uniref:Uncharacterized protein n=1 Tax=Zalerion maritima TaxID=339359 RepID=A0AAD5RRN7_9PEZI|nr:hypothetical protein MKZ38_001545 [Zalerion maritima]